MPARTAAVDTTTHTESWRGRVSTWKNLPDGSTRVTLGPDRAATGDPGFSWKYDFSSAPMVMRPGRPLPRRSTVYPFVDGVRPGSPAARAGLREGDVILSSNGVDGRTVPLIPDFRSGTAYTFRVRRGSEEREVSFELAARGS